MFKNGQIVGVHGRNISISIDQSEAHSANNEKPSFLTITLPGLNPRDVDFAVAHVGEYTQFGSCDAHLWFPEAYPSDNQPSANTIKMTVSHTG